MNIYAIMQTADVQCSLCEYLKPFGWKLLRIFPNIDCAKSNSLTYQTTKQISPQSKATLGANVFAFPAASSTHFQFPPYCSHRRILNKTHPSLASRGTSCWLKRWERHRSSSRNNAKHTHNELPSDLSQSPSGQQLFPRRSQCSLMMEN